MRIRGTWGKKDYVHFNAERVVYISFIIALKYLNFYIFLFLYFFFITIFFKKNFVVECASSSVPWVRGVFKNAR